MSITLYIIIQTFAIKLKGLVFDTGPRKLCVFVTISSSNLMIINCLGSHGVIAQWWDSWALISWSVVQIHPRLNLNIDGGELPAQV